MKKVIVLNKKEGKTPLQALDTFRARNKSYQGVKMTYAGRLDPMASGTLLVLVGEEIKKKEKYLALDKEYEFEILLGFSTDTYDVLGKVLRYSRIELEKEEISRTVEQNLKYFTGKFKQTYPVYSSKTVQGKQLFEYARSNTRVKLPTREVEVKSLKFIKLKTINSKKLLENITKRIESVDGDFRQKEITRIWKQKLSTKNPRKFFIGSFKIKCGSGTYVRGIANSLGDRIGIPALAFSIKRTKVGKWRA